jgi:HlyD family secretion protein
MKLKYMLSLPILLLAGCSSHEETSEKPVVNVKAVKAEIADVKIVVQAPASVFGRQQASISSRVTAPIRKLFVKKGDNVTEGQPLAQLENSDLIAQRDEALAIAAEAEANLQQLTASTLPTDIERARGQYTGAEATLNQAQKIYDRRQQLFDQGAIPQRELLISQTDLAQAKASYEVAKKSFELLQSQGRDKEIQIVKSKKDQAQARFALAKAQLEFTEIRSPSAGTVTEQFMFPGDMAKPDLPLFTIMDLSVAVARAQVPETDARNLKVGQSCTFIPSDKNGVSFNGTVSMVNQAVDPARRTIETWCDIPNPKRSLRSGIYGQVQIITAIAPKSVVIPLAAVQFAEGTKKGFVMVAGANGQAARKEVETGEVYEGKVQIKSGIAPSDTVIVQGAYGLPDGTQIRVQEEKKP